MNDQNDRPIDHPQAPEPAQGLTFGGLIAAVLIVGAVIFFINAFNASQEADRHQRNAECHLQRADAILDGDPNPPACPD